MPGEQGGADVGTKGGTPPAPPTSSRVPGWAACSPPKCQRPPRFCGPSRGHEPRAAAAEHGPLGGGCRLVAASRPATLVRRVQVARSTRPAPLPGGWPTQPPARRQSHLAPQPSSLHLRSPVPPLVRLPPPLPLQPPLSSPPWQPSPQLPPLAGQGGGSIAAARSIWRRRRRRAGPPSTRPVTEAGAPPAGVRETRVATS